MNPAGIVTLTSVGQRRREGSESGNTGCRIPSVECLEAMVADG